jgi:hypothetical protein
MKSVTLGLELFWDVDSFSVKDIFKSLLAPTVQWSQ